MQDISMFDCGCVRTRPRTSRLFAARWRCYITANYLILRCLDCGRLRRFVLKFPHPDMVLYDMSEVVSDAVDVLDRLKVVEGGLNG